MFAFARERIVMAWFWKKSWDWCHICGERQGNCVEVEYPRNAEHEFLGDGGDYSGGDVGRFVRMCADCGETIVRIGRGEIEEAVRNNPALVTAHIKGLSPYFVPEIN
jgi:hypothetical protein